MKEIVLTKPPYMNPSEARIADMHTVLNILNVLIGELAVIEPREEGELLTRWKRIDRELNDTARKIKEGAGVASMVSGIREAESQAPALAKDLLANETAEVRKREIEESIANLESIFSIFGERLDELDMRAEDPDVWMLVRAETFQKLFEDVFTAIAKNSKGGYEIHFDLTRKAEGDYYFDLKLDVSTNDGSLWIPLRLIDVLRDLTANARKYTAPGGKVAMFVSQDESRVRAVIEDTGCGIPEDEIEKVAEFGYRASNARQRPTLGGGFGLTKAAWLVTSWGGSLTIRSEEGSGTTISVSIPNKELPENPPLWEK
jgi:signal transduction histidine kinase